MNISIKFTVQFDTLVSSRIDLTNNSVTYFNYKPKHGTFVQYFSFFILLNIPLPISIAYNEPMKQLLCKIINSVLFQGEVRVSRLFIYLSQYTVFDYFLSKTL